jgi:hypothetical protein
VAGLPDIVLAGFFFFLCMVFELDMLSEELMLPEDPVVLGELMLPAELGADVEPAGAVVEGVEVELPLLVSAAKAAPPSKAARATAGPMTFNERM